MTTPPSERLHFLDGLRGWGSVVVVIYHAFIQCFPISPLVAEQGWRIVLVNGGIAVVLFFLVSGASLSHAQMVSPNRAALVRMSAGRYFRLAIPIFAACAIVFLLMKTGAVLPFDQRPAPFDGILRFDPTLSQLIRFSFFEVFFDFSLDKTFIAPLWTMPIELFGSFIVFGLLFAFVDSQYRLPIFGVVAVALFLAGSFYAPFVAGIVAAEFLLRPRRLHVAAAIGLVAGGAVLTALGNSPRMLMAAATLIFAGIAFCPRFAAFFGNSLGQWLGKISFPLYLVHAPVIFSVSLALAMLLERHGVDATAARLAAASVTLPISIVAAMLLVPVNDLAITVARRVGELVGARVVALRAAPR